GAGGDGELRIDGLAARRVLEVGLIRIEAPILEDDGLNAVRNGLLDLQIRQKIGRVAYWERLRMDDGDRGALDRHAAREPHALDGAGAKEWLRVSDDDLFLDDRTLGEPGEGCIDAASITEDVFVGVSGGRVSERLGIEGVDGAIRRDDARVDLRFRL